MTDPQPTEAQHEPAASGQTAKETIAPIGKEFHTPAGFELRDDENCMSAVLALSRANPNLVLFNRPANFEWVNVTAR